MIMVAYGTTYGKLILNGLWWSTLWLFEKRIAIMQYSEQVQNIIFIEQLFSPHAIARNSLRLIVNNCNLKV